MLKTNSQDKWAKKDARFLLREVWPPIDEVGGLGEGGYILTKGVRVMEVIGFKASISFGEGI